MISLITMFLTSEHQQRRKTEMLRKELGEDQYKIYNEMLRVKQMTNSAQARLPFEFFIN